MFGTMLSTYAYRIVRRDWRKYTLSFCSLALTATLITLVLSVSASTDRFLTEQSTAVLGGDVAFESNVPIDARSLFVGSAVQPIRSSQELAFSGTIAHGSTSVAVSFRVVDDSHPLYGDIEVEQGEYALPHADEILLDEAAADTLKVGVGDRVSFGTTTYTVAQIIVREPDVLLTTFRFMPRVLLSYDGFARAQVPTDLLRAEYTYRYQVEVDEEVRTDLRTRALALGALVRFADDAGVRLVRGFDTVARFLTVSVLIATVLAGVNVYANTLYLTTHVRRTIALFRALGLTTRQVRSILVILLTGMLLGALVLGIGLGTLLAGYVRSLAVVYIGRELSAVYSVGDVVVVSVVVAATALAAFVPALERMGRMTPQALLTGVYERVGTTRGKVRYVVTVLAVLSLLFISMWLLQSPLQGSVVVGGVLALYLTIAVMYRAGITLLYRGRVRYPFALRSIVSQKVHDGLFGVVAFTSLFMALTSVATLALVYASINTYVSQDLARTLPEVYVLDVQPSQQAALSAQFPRLTLFPNVRARIVSIDGRAVQDALDRGDTDVDRELGREFNVTYRTELLSSESIAAGEGPIGRPGEISVEEEFAARANIRMGSEVSLLIQSFTVNAVVTSIRTSDTRSGLPFFYFVLSPDDIGQFPATYFGYAYMTPDEQALLASHLAKEYPNVTLIDTRDAGKAVSELIDTLLFVILVIAIPPLILASMLVVALIILTYRTRRRDGARLLAIGATPRTVLVGYVFETLSTTIAAVCVSYVSAVLLTWLVTNYLLSIGEHASFDVLLVYTMGGIVLGVTILSTLLWKSDRRPLARILAYEENT